MHTGFTLYPAGLRLHAEYQGPETSETSSQRVQIGKLITIASCDISSNYGGAQRESNLKILKSGMRN